MSIPAVDQSRIFFLTEGGPSYRIEKRLRLIGEKSPRMLRAAMLAIAVTWVPLLALSALQGNAAGHRVAVPFLLDYSAHTRFLLSVPLFLLAEPFLGRRWANAARHFVKSGLVIEADFERFDAAVKGALALRDSKIAEILMVVLAFTVATIALITTAVHVSTWYALRTNSGTSLTWAGWWFTLFCVPLFQFLLLRWLWRQCIWGQFLWRMSRLKLLLMPTHPDEAGGLGFVGGAQRYFGIVLLAYSFAIAGITANRVIYDKIPLSQFAGPIAFYVICAVTIVLAPLCVFTPLLIRTKRLGLRQYSTLGTEYTSSFHKKWVISARTPEEPLLGTGDIQSLADLGNSFGFIEKMKAMPMNSRTPIHLALAGLLPMAPLLLTVMPLKEILKLLYKIVV